MQIKQSTISWAIIFGVFFFFIYLVGSILMPFVFGAIVAYFLDPMADKLEERGLTRNTSTVIVLGSFSAILITVIALLGPLLFDQVTDLISKTPEYAAQLEREYGEKVRELVHKVSPNIQDEAKDFAFKFSNEILKISGSLLTGILSSGVAIFSLLSLIFISPIIAYYLLRDWDKLVKKIDDLLPREKLSSIRKNFVNIDRIISAYIRGQVTVCLVMAVIYSVLLALVGLNYSLAIGFLTGVLSFVPYVGMTVGAVTGLTVGYIQFGFSEGLMWVAGAFVLGNLTEGNFITPKLVGNSVELHPAWVIFALLAGGTVLGFTGVLIAIPAAAVIGVLTRSSVEVYKHSPLYLGYNSMQISASFTQQEGIVTEREETPIFAGFADLKPQVRPEKKVANESLIKKKKKKKKKEPELKFPKPDNKK